MTTTGIAWYIIHLVYIYIYIYIYISEQISKNCVVTFSLCPGRSPGLSLRRPTKSEGGGLSNGTPPCSPGTKLCDHWWKLGLGLTQGGIVGLNLSGAVREIWKRSVNFLFRANWSLDSVHREFIWLGGHPRVKGWLTQGGSELLWGPCGTAGEGWGESYTGAHVSRRCVRYVVLKPLRYIYIYIYHGMKQPLTLYTPSNHINWINVWKKICPEWDLNPRPPAY